MEYNKKDLINQRFGRLTVIEETSKRTKSGGIIWKCKCDCGNIIELESRKLTQNINRSCGCFHKEVVKKLMNNLNKKQFVEKTNLDLISKKQPNKNNKTGVRGVCYINSKHKYKAYIYVNKQYHHLGYFENKDKAIKARKKAEEIYHKPILEKYSKKSKKSVDKN